MYNSKLLCMQSVCVALCMLSILHLYMHAAWLSVKCQAGAVHICHQYAAYWLQLSDIYYNGSRHATQLKATKLVTDHHIVTYSASVSVVQGTGNSCPQHIV